jgi:ubiquinone/menaquinone biosynthesis C-methylase UbiE
MSRTLESVYQDIWQAHGDELAEFDRSLGPRPPEMLYELAGRMALHPGSTVLDMGCGRGAHALELARRFGCRVVGVDLMRHLLPPATGRVFFAQATVEAMPLATSVFDLIWCRDMLVHVRDLDRTCAECARLLKPGGSWLLFATEATGLMEPREAARLYADLALHAESLSRARLEAAFQKAGLSIRGREELGSELIEYYEERDGRAGRELMRLARMRRLGCQQTPRCLTAHAVYHWMIYHLLGKLSSVIYTLTSRDDFPTAPRAAAG